VTTFVALLRAVNVAGHQQVAMSDLRELLARLGFKDVRSLLQSGNLVFRSASGDTTRSERRLETAAKRELGLGAEFFVRSAEELRALVAGNPFPNEAKRDPGHLLAVFLKAAPDAASAKALSEAITGREMVRVIGRHAYIVYPDGVGRSRLTNALIERKLGTRGTARNWNTILKLGALADV
jgi:uncharacterized protein (DUF1697 family)